VKSFTAVFSYLKALLSFQSMTYENSCEPSPILALLGAKFCVSHGGFGVMATAPLVSIET